MIRVELVVAGAMGDLVQSMFPNMRTERQQSTRVLVADQAAVAELMATLERAGVEVQRVVELPQPEALPAAGEAE